MQRILSINMVHLLVGPISTIYAFMFSLFVAIIYVRRLVAYMGSILGVLVFLFVFACSTIASPEALCPSSTFDFGERPATATVTNAFPVVNAGDADLALGDARACCGATLSVPNPVVAPGATNLVLATLSLTGREPGRPVRKALYLATSDPARPWLRFEFTGSVSPAKEAEGQ